jgi:hypothetical protein
LMMMMMKKKRVPLPCTVSVEMMECVLPYGFEYQGASPARLVVTPLTARVQQGLLTSLHCHLGGVVQGRPGPFKRIHTRKRKRTRKRTLTSGLSSIAHVLGL